MIKLFNKKQDKGEAQEFESVDVNKQDKLQVVISRLENDTKVTIKSFFATHWVDKETNVAYWINDKQKFKQPVADYYLTTIKSDIKKSRTELESKLTELEKIYAKEIDKTKPDPKVNIADVEHEMEVIRHQLYLLKFAGNGYSVINRNIQNFRKIEYIEIGSKLYPLGFNPKLMTYFIIPIDKDITLDKHRENVTIKHTTSLQKLIASATILMLLITVGLALITSIAGYKLYFAYDETHIADLERACAGSAITNSVLYEQATNSFAESTKDFQELVKDFQAQNKDLLEIKQVATSGNK